MANLEVGRHESDICIDGDEARGISHGSDISGCLCCMPQDQFRLMVCEALREWMLFSMPIAANTELEISPGRRILIEPNLRGAPLNVSNASEVVRSLEQRHHA